MDNKDIFIQEFEKLNRPSLITNRDEDLINKDYQ